MICRAWFGASLSLRILHEYDFNVAKKRKIEVCKVEEIIQLLVVFHSLSLQLTVTKLMKSSSVSLALVL